MVGIIMKEFIKQFCDPNGTVSAPQVTGFIAMCAAFTLAFLSPLFPSYKDAIWTIGGMGVALLTGGTVEVWAVKRGAQQ